MEKIMVYKINLPNKTKYPDGISNQAYGIESCANAYFESHPITKRIFLNRLEKAISLIPTNRSYSNILDLGTGIGALLPTLSGLYKDSKIIGADYSPILHSTKGMIEKSQINNINLVRSDMRNISFYPNSFDLIISLSALEHIDDLPKAFEEISRILKDDGIFIAGWPHEATFLNFMRRIDSIFLRPKMYKKGKESFKEGVISAHVSNYKDLRNNLEDKFKVIDLRSLLCNYDFFKIYEIYACIKL